MKRLLWGLLLCLLAHLAAEEEMTISSGEAQYNGETITLEGDVNLQSSLGVLAARHVILFPVFGEEKKLRFSHAIFKKDVSVQLIDGGSLICQEGEFDYAHLTGRFTGNAVDPEVVYERKGEDVRPLVIKCASLHADFERLPSRQVSLKQLEARGDVRAFYNQSYFLRADEGAYSPLTSQEGILIFRMMDNRSFCVLTTINSDCLQAGKIEMNTLDRTLKLLNVQGSFKGIHFTADEALINDKTQSLSLLGQVFIKQGEELEIRTKHGAIIQQEKLGEGTGIRSLCFKQETEMSYMDDTASRRIFCPGPLLIDHGRAQATFDAWEKEKGILDQVIFEEGNGEMSANRMQLHYANPAKKWVPTDIILEGDVKIDNRFDGHIQESGAVLQQVFADHVVYNLAGQEMIMTAQTGNRVILFDKVNQIRMSAPALKIKRDAEKKSSIQGIGDVRFTFIKPILPQANE